MHTEIQTMLATTELATLSRQWLARILLCLSLLLAQFLVLGHVHADEPDHSLANHDCVTCIVGEQVQSPLARATQAQCPTAQQPALQCDYLAFYYNPAPAPYQGRAPPYAPAV